MTDSQIWRIQILGRYGFSYKFIERRVFRTVAMHKRDIAKALRYGKIRLKDYRDGESSAGKAVARSYLK